jgi:hypothetical protein
MDENDMDAGGFWNMSGKLNTKSRVDVLITGTGSLAESIVLSWRLAGPQKMAIVSRSEESAKSLAKLAEFRAAARNEKLACVSTATTWGESDLEELLKHFRPRLVLHVSSWQSPWPKNDADSPWRKAFREHGYGVTSVLQAVLAFRLARAARKCSPKTVIVNCCYPDIVNRLLSEAGLRILCGAGNVGIITALWNGIAKPKKPARLLAHHAHLAQLTRPRLGSDMYPRAWHGEAECRGVRKAFETAEIPRGKAMNLLTGAAIANLGQALLGKKSVPEHAVCPLGLPGGYPVLAGAGKVKLNLPRGLSLGAAVEFNAACEAPEGIQSIDENGLRYTAPLAAVFRRYDSKFAEGFKLDEIEAAAADMVSVRERMGGA